MTSVLKHKINIHSHYPMIPLMLSFGSTEYSAITNWTSAGDMATDTWANQNADDKNVLRAETTVGGLKVSVSQNVAANKYSSSDPVFAYSWRITWWRIIRDC